MSVQAVEPGLAATGENPQTAIPAQERAQEAATQHEAQTRLQDVLPEIMDLAQRVGGLGKLAELLATLQESKE